MQSSVISKSELDSAHFKKSQDENLTELIGMNIVENIKPEDLDDTHCRITPDLRASKPKPFFNKSIVVNQSISIQ